METGTQTTDAERRSAWVNDRYHAALAARPLQDAGVILRDLEAHWDLLHSQGAL